LDSDEAGRRAAARAVPLLLAEGLEVRVLVLRSDKDPGDYFARGASAAEFEALLAQDGVAGLDFLLEQAGLRSARRGADRLRVARAAADALAGLRDPLARAATIRHLATALDLPADALDRALRAREPARLPAARSIGGAPATNAAAAAAAAESKGRA